MVDCDAPVYLEGFSSSIERRKVCQGHCTNYHAFATVDSKLNGRDHRIEWYNQPRIPNHAAGIEESVVADVDI